MKTTCVGRIAGWMGAAVLALASAPAFADGLIVIHNPPHSVPGHFSFAPLEVVHHRVDVEITDLVATTTIDQEFRNPGDQRLEGTYLFPLPPGAHIDKFSMDVNGKMMDAELLSADKARSIYEEIVRKARDPALLEYVGRGAFKVRIFPIEPRSRKPIRITYTQLLKSDSGLTEYVYPLNTEKFSSAPLKEVAVRIALKTKDPLKSVYCPTHNVEIRREGDRKAVIGFEGKDIRPDTDFKLIFTRTPNPLGMDLLTYKKEGEDGYFLLLASPGAVEPRSAQPKDICFVLDTSGSMAGPKLEQARKAMRFCLANLNENDCFEIVRFSTEAEPLFNALRPATRANLDKAEAMVAAMKPMGGTAIAEALGKALSLRAGAAADAAARPYLVIFLTDGLPTIGETSEDAIVSEVKKINTAHTRIFAFGVGSDVNTHLLDRIAEETRAISQYVGAEEDLEVRLSNFYTKIKEPVLSGISLDVTTPGIRISQLYPRELPDVFNGDMLVVFGRYTGAGPSAIKIGGLLGGQKREFVADVNFEERHTANTFIPRLWATRRVGWLLDEIRLRGESAELRDEATRLAREFGIVTPYTAYLIMEDESRRNVPVAMRNFQEMERDRAPRELAAKSFASVRAEAADERTRSGARAVYNAKAVQGLRYSWNEQQASFGDGLDKKAIAAATPGSAPASAGYRVAQNYSQQSRVLNGRAFYQNGTQWIDSTAQGRKGLKQQKVIFNSDEYFALIRSNADAAAWLSLGNEVDVVIDDVLYQIRES